MLKRLLASLSLFALASACASTSNNLAATSPYGEHDPEDANIETPNGETLQLRWRPSDSHPYEQSLWRLNAAGELEEKLVDWGDWKRIQPTDDNHFFGKDFDGDWYRIDAAGETTAMDDWAGLYDCTDDHGNWAWFAQHKVRDELSRIAPDGTALVTVPALRFEYSNNNFLTTMDAEEVGDETRWVVRNLDLEPLLTDARFIESTLYEVRSESAPVPYLGKVPGGGVAFYRFPLDRVPGATFAKAERLGIPFKQEAPFAWLLQSAAGGPSSLWGPDLEEPVIEGVTSVEYARQEFGGDPMAFYDCLLESGEHALVSINRGGLLLLARGSDPSTFESQALAARAAADQRQLQRRAGFLLELNEGETVDPDFKVAELHRSFADLAYGNYLIGTRGGEVQLAVRGEDGTARYLGSGYSAIGPVGTTLPSALRESGFDPSLVAWQVQDAATGAWSVRSLDMQTELASPSVVTSFNAKIIPAVGSPRIQYDTQDSARAYGRVYNYETAEAPSRFLDDGSYFELVPMLEPGEYGPEIVGWFGTQRDGWVKEFSRDMDHVFHEGYELAMTKRPDQYGREREAWTWGDRDGTWRLSLLPDYRGASHDELLAELPSLLHQAGEQFQAEEELRLARIAKAREEAIARNAAETARRGCPDCGGTGFELAGWKPADTESGRIYILQGKWVVRHFGGLWGNDHVTFEPKICDTCNGAGLGTEPVPFREPTIYE